MFEAKKTLVRSAQLKVQELVLPYKIVGNATPASAVVTIDDPSVLFIETESTSAVGGSDISALLDSGETLTIEAADDSDGEYNALVVIGEKIKKVISVEARVRATGAVIPCTFPSTAPADAITSSVEGGTDADDAVVFSVDHGADLTAATVDAVLIVKYVVE